MVQQMTADLVEPAPIFGRPMMILPDALMELVQGNPLLSRFVGSRRGGDTPYAMTEDGIAIISILGPLANRTGYMRSYEFIQHQLNSARTDPQCRGAMLDIESPGGQASGAFETAAAVRALAAEKTVVAVVNGMAASAAYAIASAATRIVTTPSGLSGSIGVVMVHADYSGLLAKAGVAPTLIFAGAHKVDGNPYQPLTDESRASLQQEVEGVYEQFVNAVAAGRKKLTPAAIRATEARLFTGADAVSAGLVDEVGTFETALVGLLPRSTAIARGMRLATDRAEPEPAAAVASPPPHTDIPSGGSSNTMAEITQADIDRARSEGRQAAAARVAAILGLEEAKGREDFAKTYAFDTDLSVDEVKTRLAAKPKTGAAADLETRAADVPHLGASGGSVHPDKQAAIDASWDSIVKVENDRRGLTVPRR